MRITSEDRNTVLEIIANDPDDPCFGYRLRAIVEDGPNFTLRKAFNLLEKASYSIEVAQIARHGIDAFS